VDSFISDPLCQPRLLKSRLRDCSVVNMIQIYKNVTLKKRYI
jgi:hypothetical protein